jgi:hypothetical protein
MPKRHHRPAAKERRRPTAVDFKVPPPPPAARDPWLWASLLALLPLLAHAWGAPFGEPVAEDFDFLYRIVFTHDRSLLDGGGSTAFWRPLSFQIYYQTMAPLILDHPWAVGVLHGVLLALGTVFAYRMLRRFWPGPWAAVAASFPLLSESTRALISWPSHFVDLGVWLFTVVALHEAAARRLITTLIALLAALLCKEVAVVAALMIPWMPSPGTVGRRVRVRWLGATGGLALLWGVAYLFVRRHAGLELPHGLETSAGNAASPLSDRLGWACWNSLRALFSLPAVSTPRDVGLAAVSVLLVVGAAACLALVARSRARLKSQMPWVVWGAGWFLGASATLAAVHPFWAPNRSIYGGIGFGIVVAPLLGAAHPVLLAGLVALRLAAFAMSPGPPAAVSITAPNTGAFVDFEHVVRLQRLMVETRGLLESRYPTLPRGGSVGQFFMPWFAEYAYGGDKALRVWYRDSTLRWVRFEDFQKHRQTPITTIVEYGAYPRPHLALVSPEAMRHKLASNTLLVQGAWRQALVELERADSLQRDPAAREFLGLVAGARAVALIGLEQYEAAEAEARRGIALLPTEPNAHMALGWAYYHQNRLAEALAESDTALSVTPDHPGALSLRDEIRRSTTGHR